MKLLNDIVDLLSAKSGSLTDAMLKTKVLMHRIGHKELVDWVNDELNGYGQTKPIPAYRVVGVRLMGDLQNPGWRYTNRALPTAHLPDDLHRKCTQSEMHQSVGVLEQFASSSDGTPLISPIPPELHSIIGRPFENAMVTRAWTQIEPTQILNVLIEVRSRLLDFVLNLQAELGDVPENDMKEAGKGIDAGSLLASAVFGDNTTVIVGQHNVATVTNTITKGDFNSLAETLKKAGVDDADVEDLRTAIDEDDTAVVVREKQFGPKVKAWMTNMAGKAIGGGWAIGIAAGGKLLADALAAHYGIK
jgi:hypothetical protein